MCNYIQFYNQYVKNAEYYKRSVTWRRTRKVYDNSKFKAAFRLFSLRIQGVQIFMYYAFKHWGIIPWTPKQKRTN